jgi:3-methyladenine DNA glycosylase/8-oxoguanine DNA glycosylase
MTEETKTTEQINKEFYAAALAGFQVTHPEATFTVRQNGLTQITVTNVIHYEWTRHHGKLGIELHFEADKDTETKNFAPANDMLAKLEGYSFKKWRNDRWASVYVEKAIAEATVEWASEEMGNLYDATYSFLKPAAEATTEAEPKAVATSKVKKGGKAKKVLATAKEEAIEEPIVEVEANLDELVENLFK